MPEAGIAWILDRVAALAYERFLAEHGGPAGRPDPVRLAAALALPRTVAAFTDGRPRLSTLAAEHARAVLRLRPFPQGNDAMACLLAMLFLKINGVELPAPVVEKYGMFAGLADGRIDARTLAQWLRMRYLASRRGVESVVQVRIRDNTVHSVATLQDLPPAKPPAVRGRPRRTPIRPPA